MEARVKTKERKIMQQILDCLLECMVMVVILSVSILGTLAAGM